MNFLPCVASQGCSDLLVSGEVYISNWTVSKRPTNNLQFTAWLSELNTELETMIHKESVTEALGPHKKTVFVWVCCKQPSDRMTWSSNYIYVCRQCWNHLNEGFHIKLWISVVHFLKICWLGYNFFRSSYMYEQKQTNIMFMNNLCPPLGSAIEQNRTCQ